MKSNFETFFELNLKIKNLLPDTNDIYIFTSTNETINYMDNLCKTVKTLKYYFELINEITHLLKPEYLQNFFNTIYYEIVKISPNNKETIKNLIEKRFYKMDPCLTNDISKEFLGYSMFDEENLDTFNKITSLNELLHYYHSYMLNNELFYEDMPEVYKSENFEGYSLTLRGKETSLGKKLLENLKEISLGYTDICVLENKLIIMIRDKAHALSIEIEEENNLYYVKYHIPKICNLDMVNNLNGVKQITENDRSTLGSFISSKETILQDLTEFIRDVPTDDNILEQYFSKR